MIMHNVICQIMIPHSSIDSVIAAHDPICWIWGSGDSNYPWRSTRFAYVYSWVVWWSAVDRQGYHAAVKVGTSYHVEPPDPILLQLWKHLQTLHCCLLVYLSAVSLSVIRRRVKST